MPGCSFRHARWDAAVKSALTEPYCATACALVQAGPRVAQRSTVSDAVVEHRLTKCARDRKGSSSLLPRGLRRRCQEGSSQDQYDDEAADESPVRYLLIVYAPFDAFRQNQTKLFTATIVFTRYVLPTVRKSRAGA